MNSLTIVEQHLRNHPNLKKHASLSVAKSLQSVLGNRKLSEISPDNKAMIGSTLESYFLPAMNLPKRDKGVDTQILGIEVDVKHSIGTSWMIGPECVGHVCLLFKTNYDENTFCVGLQRASEENITKGKNRDRKVSFNAEGKKTIRWIIEREPIPPLPKTIEERMSVIEEKLDILLNRTLGS